MADQQEGCSGAGMTVLVFLSGAILGATAAMLYAPNSGQETRRAIKSYARRTEEEVLEKAKEVRKEISHTVDEAKRYLKETEATIAAALAAGKEAFKKDKTERA
ncbi:MAG: YtxH domain-containing protein [Nitrospira sp.]|nr:YtxH domain-containing protein [Nitrospira sp.]